MLDISMLLWLIPLAVALDLGLRYPGILLHPVQLVGRWLRWIEPRLRTLAPRLERTEGYLPDVLCSGLVRAGLLGVLLTVFGTAAIAFGLCSLPGIGVLAAIVLAWTGLSLGQLLRVGREALEVLEKVGPDGRLDPDDLEKARFQVSMLVSRDVSQAKEEDLCRALAETLAENFNDGFVCPLFWLTLGGPVALWGYKAASTMDSMWGYRTPEWELFGKTAARLDDILGYVPARICAFLLWLTAPQAFAGEGGRWPKLSVFRSQARRMSSINAGWPMAAAAWSHGAIMGGPTVYHGEIVDKPRLGPEDKTPHDCLWNPVRLRSLMHHLLLAGLAGTGLAVLIIAALVL